MLPLSSCRPTLEKRAARPREAASGVFPWEWVLACVVLIVQERDRSQASRELQLGPITSALNALGASFSAPG